MANGFFRVPPAYNEPVKSYAPGSPEREAVLKQYDAYYNSNRDIPLTIGGEKVRTGNTRPIAPPHDHQHQVGQYHLASEKEVRQAIDTALAARASWAALPWDQRASVFLKAAEWEGTTQDPRSLSTKRGGPKPSPRPRLTPPVS